MSKLDELRRGVGDNVGESMGVGRPAPSHGETGTGGAAAPVRLQGIIKAKDAAIIPVDRIQPDPDQPREEFDDEALDRLAESLKTHGQLQPVRVRWNDQLESYVLLCGERRWRAAVKAGLKTMECVIQAGVLTAGELLGMQLVENLLREDLRPIEEAKAYRSLMTLNGWSARQLARELALGHAGVAKTLALLELPESVQDQVERGALPPSVAYEVSRLGDDATIMAVAAEVTAGKLSRAETVERVRQVTSSRGAKGKGRGTPSRPEPITIDLGDASVMIRWKQSGSSAVQVLRRALKEAQERERQPESDAA